MKHYSKWRIFCSTYSIIDFINDFLKEVFFAILIGILCKIGRFLISRYRLPMKKVAFHAILFLYGHGIERIELRLLEFFPKRLSGVAIHVNQTYAMFCSKSIKIALDCALKGEHTVESRSLFLLFLKGLSPSLKRIAKVTVSHGFGRGTSKAQLYYAPIMRMNYATKTFE